MASQDKKSEIEQLNKEDDLQDKIFQQYWGCKNKPCVAVKTFFHDHGLLTTALKDIFARTFSKKKSFNSQWQKAKDYCLSKKEFCEVFEHKRFKTMFKSDYRLYGLNVKEDVRLQEGLKISLKALQLIKQRLDSENVNLAILVIPTKEMVFKDLAYQDPSNISQSYKILMENEQEVLSEVSRFAEENNIDLINTLPVLRYCLKKGMQPYKVSTDGHPNKLGQSAIAKAAADYLK